MATRRVRPLLRLLALTVCGAGCAHPVVPAPLAPAPSDVRAPQIRDPVAMLYVHGGDGDGSIAIWSLELSCDVVAAGPDSVAVHSLRWEALELGLTAERPTARLLRPAAPLRLHADAYIAVEDLERVRRAVSIPTRWTIVWSDGEGPPSEHQSDVPAVVRHW